MVRTFVLVDGHTHAVGAVGRERDAHAHHGRAEGAERVGEAGRASHDLIGGWMVGDEWERVDWLAA